MTRPRPRIGSELLPVVLILACLAGTGFLVVSMHRRASVQRKAARAIVQAAPTPTAAPVSVRVEPPPAPPPPPEPKPEPPPIPAPPPEDPTRQVLARLGTEEAEQLLAAQEADRKAVALETARLAAIAESEKWRRREMMARAQLDELDSRARKLEEDADMLAMDRDVLANERDAARAALAKAANRAGSYAILPNKSPNGTWRRPIILECKNGTAILQPKGPTLSLLDLSPLLSPRSSPLINVVVGEMLRVRGLTTPDGSAAVPYIFFVVRPDGILPYYQARARLESLGITFGYELVDQDMEIEYPDLDNVDEWDGAGPPIASSSAVADVREPAWPSNRPGRARDGRADPADAFVWPTHPQPSAGGADLSGLDRPPSGPGSGSGRGGPGADDGTGGRGGSPPGRGMGGGSPGLGDGMGRFGPSLVDGQAPGMSPGRGPGRGPGQGGSGFGPDPGIGGNGTAPFPDPGPFGGPLAGTPGPSSVNPPRGIGGGSGTAGAPRGLVPLSPDRLPGLEEATALANLDRQASAGGSGGQGNPGEPGSHSGDPGMPGSAETGGSSETSGSGSNAGSGSSSGSGSGSGSGTGGTGRTRVGAGQRGGGGGSQGPQSGVPVGLGPISQGDGSRQGTSSGQPSQGSGFGSSSGGSGERGPSARPGGTDSLGRPLKIDAALEIVVACGPDGLVLHPGGYRISKEVLKSKNSLLAKQLTTIVQLRQQVDPLIRPIPSIRFLVEPMGNDTYREARRQTVLSGVDWPITLQLGDSNILDFVPEERF